MDLLIGHTGFVGSTLARAKHFDRTVNSKTIDDIRGATFDLVVNCGVPAEKWRANQCPDQDRSNIGKLTDVLSTIKCKRFVQISTIDVFASPVQVTEDNIPEQENSHPYGRHRHELEQFVTNHFSQVNILRLPGLFGEGLKKNIIFDLLHMRLLENINPSAQFQWYPLHRLPHDIERTIGGNIPLLHLAPPPLQTCEIVERLFPAVQLGCASEPAPKYDFRTKYDGLFGRNDGYIMSKVEVFHALESFVSQQVTSQ